MINILLIEDNPADVLLFREYLSDTSLAGSVITHARTMEEATQISAQEPYDVVMLDLFLPDCQGEQTVQRARQHFGQLPIVILSGTDDQEFAQAAVKNGVQDYVLKERLGNTALDRVICYAIERNKLMNEKALVERHLQERNHRLEIANRRLEQFAYAVSHNLRAPLSRILGLTQIIGYQQDMEEVHMMTDLIDKAAKGLDSSLRDLMELLVVQQDINKTVSRVDVSQVFADVHDALLVQIQQANATVTFDAVGPPSFLYSETILRSVLLNLLTNSLKYHSPRRPPKIHVRLQATEPNVYQLSVSDNGLGMDLNNVRPHLFKLFKRFHTHTEGKGIGLYMIKHMIEEMEGHIEVESTVDVGTTFRIYFHDQQADQPQQV